MKYIIAIVAVGFCLAVSILGATPTSATGVHHPDCDGILVKDQPPYSGLSVTVPPGYSNVTMWLKISNQHVMVPAVSSGETYTPDDLSSWPRNKKNKPQDISHVDYCVPEAPPETTVPPTTTLPPTTTTVPPTTQPPVTTQPEPTAPETTAPETTQPPVVTDPCQEDEPCWDCETMGNRQCGASSTSSPEAPVSPSQPPQAPSGPVTPEQPMLPATGLSGDFVAIAGFVVALGLLLWVIYVVSGRFD